MEGTSNIFDGSIGMSKVRSRYEMSIPSRSRRSGSQKRALASASLILHPPENVLVGYCCLSGENPRPARMVAALDSALSDSISVSFACMSVRVVSSPSLSLSNLSASEDLSAIEDRSVSSAVSCLVIFYSVVSGHSVQISKF